MKFLIIITVFYLALKPYDAQLTEMLHIRSPSLIFVMAAIAAGMIFTAYRPKLSGFIAGTALLALGGLKAYGYVDDLIAPAPLNVYLFGGGALWLMVAFFGLSQPKANKDAKEKPEDPQARLQRQVSEILDNQELILRRLNGLGELVNTKVEQLHGHLKQLATQRPSSATELQAVLQELQALPMFVDGALPGKVAQYREVLETLRQLPGTEGLSPDALRRLGELIAAAHNLPDEMPEPAKLARAATAAAQLADLQPKLAPPVTGEAGLEHIREEFTAGYADATERVNSPDYSDFEGIYDDTIEELLRIYPELEDYESLDIKAFDNLLRRKAYLWAREFMKNEWGEERSNIDEDEWKNALEKLTKLQLAAYQNVKV